MSVLLNLLALFCEALIVCIFLRSVFSWANPVPTNPVTKLLFQITEPILAPLRRIVPRFGIADFTPFVAIVILWIIIQVLSFIH